MFLFEDSAAYFIWNVSNKTQETKTSNCVKRVTQEEEIPPRSPRYGAIILSYRLGKQLENGRENVLWFIVLWLITYGKTNNYQTRYKNRKTIIPHEDLTTTLRYGSTVRTIEDLKILKGSFPQYWDKYSRDMLSYFLPKRLSFHQLYIYILDNLHPWKSDRETVEAKLLVSGGSSDGPQFTFVFLHMWYLIW